MVQETLGGGHCAQSSKSSQFLWHVNHSMCGVGSGFDVGG